MKLLGKFLALVAFCLHLASISAQNVGIGTSSPISKLHISTNASADGLLIDNYGGNGDPVIVLSIDGAPTFSMGVDDSDADKFKIGTSAITTNTRLTIQANGYIGVGTTSPTHEFEVRGNHPSDYLGYYENTAANGASLAGYTSGTFNALGGITNNNAGLANYGVHLPSTGAGLGVWGTSNSSDAIGVRGNVPTTGSWLGYGGYFTGGLGYANGLYNLSDARTKKNVESLQNALDKVKQLRGVSFQYNEAYSKFHGGDNRVYNGFVAQEVEMVVPEAVAEKYLLSSTSAQIDGAVDASKIEHQTVKVVDYVSLVPLLVEAIKEQQATIDALQHRIKELEDKN